jgi:hypothetical protein
MPSEDQLKQLREQAGAQTAPAGPTPELLNQLQALFGNGPTDEQRAQMQKALEDAARQFSEFLGAVSPK